MSHDTGGAVDVASHAPRVALSPGVRRPLPTDGFRRRGGIKGVCEHTPSEGV